MPRDRPRRLQRALVGRIDDQLRRWHSWAIEGPGRVELSVPVDVAQLAEALAWLGGDSLLELGVAAGELDEVEAAHTRLYALLQRRDEPTTDGFFRGEGHDDAADLRLERGLDAQVPDIFAQRHERRSSEWEERCDEVDNGVVVEQSISSLGGEVFADGQLTDAGAAEQEENIGHGEKDGSDSARRRGRVDSEERLGRFLCI